MKLAVFLVLFSISFFAQAEISLQIDFPVSPVPEARVIMSEKGEGKLKALAETLDENSDGVAEFSNSDRSVDVRCSITQITDITTCTWRFISAFPHVVVMPSQKGFYAKQQLEDFKGLKILNDNPGLSIDMKLDPQNGNFFEFDMGLGKIWAGGRKNN